MKIDPDQWELLTFAIINPVTLLGLALVIIIIYIMNFNMDDKILFLYSIAFSIFIFGITLGYSNKSIKDQKNLKDELFNYLKKDGSEKEIKNNSDDKIDDSSITEEDKLIMQHLFERHRVSLNSGDAIDLKLAQMIALNGLILSFILIKSSDVKNISVFVFGISLLVVSIIIGVIGYRSTEWCAGANTIFFKECGNKFSSKEGLRKLKEMLSDDIQENKETLNRKSEFFNIMLYFNILGLVIVIIGYYV